MRRFGYLFLILLSLLLSSCKERIMSISEIEKKDGFYYEKLFKKKYTGKAISMTEDEEWIFKEGELIEYSKYYKNRKLNQELKFKNNVLDGIIKFYHPNGQLKSETMWENGKIKDGITNQYHENGKLAAIETYKNGELNGMFKSYHSNGQLKFETMWENGKIKDGIIKSYSENGEVMGREIFKNGIMIKKEEISK